MVRNRLWIGMMLLALVVALVCVSCFSPWTGEEIGKTGSVVVRIRTAQSRAAITDPPTDDNIGQIEHTVLLTKVNLVDGEYAPLEETTEHPISSSGVTTISDLTLNALYSIDVIGKWYGIAYSFSTESLIVHITGPNTETETITMDVSSNFTPYLGYTPITSAAELRTLATQSDPENFPLDGDYLLTADNIDLSAYNWTPIGVGSGAFTQFTGIFDGNNKTIRGLYISASADVWQSQGLFGVINGGTVKNLKLENSTIIAPGSYDVGTIVGGNYGGVISNCVVQDGSVEGKDSVGGIAGHSNGEISDCVVSGNSTVTCSTYPAGGVVGVNENGIVTRSRSSADVTGNAQVGGVAGQNYLNSHISYCSSTGDITGENFVGGVVGYNNDGVVSYCSSAGNITGEHSLGGVAGMNEAIIDYCFSTGNLTGDNTIGGVAGTNVDTGDGGGMVRYSYYAAGTVTGSAYVGGMAGYSPSGIIERCYVSGSAVLVPSLLDPPIVPMDYIGGVVGQNGDTVTGCVALNTKLTMPAGVTNVGRVVGANNGGTISGQYGKTDMIKTQGGVDSSTWTNLILDGADVSEDGGDGPGGNLGYLDADWWMGLGFNPAVWNFDSLASGQLPKLAWELEENAP